MCGIWLLLSQTTGFTVDQFKAFSRFSSRGPDYSKRVSMNLKNFPMNTLTFGFHRLSIMDVSMNGSQPFEIVDGSRTVYLMCNGEIYNFEFLAQKLKQEHNVTMRSRSDCEVLPHLYIHYGFEKMLEMLHTAEFAIILVDHNTDTDTYNFYCARDHAGVRPLYYGMGSDYICFSSQLDGMPEFDTVESGQFPPGCYIHFTMNKGVQETPQQLVDKIVKYYDIEKHAISTDMDRFIVSELHATSHIYTIFTEAVKARLHSDRPIAALLSGGLDSSLVCAIASAELRKEGKVLKTFSIGLPGSTDKYYAEKVSKFIGSDHTHVECTTEDFVETAKKIPGLISSYDTTTVRASTGQYLISKYVSDHTDYKVLLVGDGSDELCSGYVYFHKAPSAWESHMENIRLVQDIHLYDGLRADRCVAINGIEVRLPFLDVKFIDTYLSIDPELRIPRDYKGVMAEKYLLRKAFVGLLPEDCLWRPKEAFSDGVSGLKKSWFQMYQEYADSQYTDEEFNELSSKFSHYTPVSKEELLNRINFNTAFSENVARVVPYRWVPLEKWVGKMTEPSARVLDVYKQKDHSSEDKGSVGSSSDESVSV